MRSLLVLLACAKAILGAAIPHDELTKIDLWQPIVGAKFQMILTNVVDPSAGTIQPSDAGIFDIDLFYHNKSTIDVLHSQGKKVICYFSAGSSEDWRPDYDSFLPADKGPCLSGWAGERRVDPRSANVFDVMKKRIQLASEKGCDGIDPDNVDGEGNFGTTEQDWLNYIKKLSAEAHSYGMSMGLKNTQDLIPQLINDIEFAVNEECALSSGDCDPYDQLTAAGKPVFHLEYVTYTVVNGQPVIKSAAYPNLSSNQVRDKLCLAGSRRSATFSTDIKLLNLNGWVEFCDGSWTETKTTSDGVVKGLKDCPDGN